MSFLYSKTSNGFHHIQNKIHSAFSAPQGSGWSSHWSLSNTIFFFLTTYTTWHSLYCVFICLWTIPSPPLDYLKLRDSKGLSFLFTAISSVPRSVPDHVDFKKKKKIITKSIIEHVIFIMHIIVMLELTLYQIKRKKNLLSAALSDFVICLYNNGWKLW